MVGRDALQAADRDRLFLHAPATAGRLYLIDPLGNLVLSYSAQAPDKALLTDVKKLLRLSHIG